VAQRASHNLPEPLAVARLSGDNGAEVALDVFQVPVGPQAAVAWHALTVLPGPPGTLRLLEDEEDLELALSGGDSRAGFEAGSSYSGTGCLKVSSATSAPAAAARLEGLAVPIRRNCAPGEYRYLRFAWKLAGGKRISLQPICDFEPIREGERAVAPRGEERAFAYEAGPGPAGRGRLAREAPREWTAVTRDLHADLGDCTLRGLVLGAPEGGEASFDHIYLARSAGDFRWLDSWREEK
jgi:hypothetical protein